MENKLKMEIHFQNENRKIFNLIEEKVKNYFKQYTETKILKEGNSLIKSISEDEFIKDLLNEKKYKVKPFKNGFANLNLYFKSSDYSVMLRIKLCFSGGKYEDKTYYCQYVENDLYIGNLENKTLKNVNETEKYKILSFKEEHKNIKKYIAKKEELNLIENKIDYTLRTFLKYY